MAQTKNGAMKIAAKAAGMSLDEFRALVESGMKRCTGCKTWHKTEEFGVDASRYDGLASTCTSFRRIRSRNLYTPKGRCRNEVSFGSLPIDHTLPQNASIFPDRLRLKLRLSDHEASCGGLCLEWQGSTNKSGYGKASYNGKLWTVHRLAMLLKNGTIPRGMFVCHRCDNPRCCNTDHLFIGTSKDNCADKVSKGRQTKGNDTWVRKYPERLKRGQENHLSKLTMEQARDVILRRRNGESQRGIASDLGIHYNHVGRIFRGERWSHLMENNHEQD